MGRRRDLALPGRWLLRRLIPDRPGLVDVLWTSTLLFRHRGPRRPRRPPRDRMWRRRAPAHPLQHGAGLGARRGRRRDRHRNQGHRGRRSRRDRPGRPSPASGRGRHTVASVPAGRRRDGAHPRAPVGGWHLATNSAAPVARSRWRRRGARAYEWSAGLLPDATLRTVVFAASALACVLLTLAVCRVANPRGEPRPTSPSSSPSRCPGYAAGRRIRSRGTTNSSGRSRPPLPGPCRMPLARLQLARATVPGWLCPRSGRRDEPGGRIGHSGLAARRRAGGRSRRVAGPARLGRPPATRLSRPPPAR